ncbi:flagellar hook-length control protein FliK [Cupriavidus sp. 2TAF22]|uniref:flagellar hook-length control protein FliK n=1 Tax=unclassified Cupriavidus TaxID=2640874 RepID=UPI003F8FCB80
MTGIPVSSDASLLRDLNPQSLRTALSVSKLSALLPTAPLPEGNPQTSTGSAVQGRTVLPLPSAAQAGQPAQSGSTREILSSAARVILDLLERVDVQPQRSAASLLPSPPTAAGAPALRAALADAIGRSGLFYESHLAEWVSGARPLELLRKEPQAMLRAPGAGAGTAQGPAPAPDKAGAPPAPLLLLPAPAATAGAPAPLTPGGAMAEADSPLQLLAEDGQATQADARGPAPSPRGGAATETAAQTNATPATLQQPAHPGRAAALASQAAQAYEATAKGADAPRHRETRLGTLLATASIDDHAAARSSGPATVLHPGAEGVVRQQLELLAGQQLRWAGEAWPGTPMDWEIRREHADDGSAGTAAAAWSTRLVLNLPHMGTVEARLTLNSTGLDARIVTADGSVASRMNADRSALSGNLAASGIVLMRLDVDTGEPATPGTGR